MSAPPVTVPSSTSIAAAARYMDHAAVKRRAAARDSGADQFEAAGRIAASLIRARAS